MKKVFFSFLAVALLLGGCAGEPDAGNSKEAIAETSSAETSVAGSEEVAEESAQSSEQEEDTGYLTSYIPPDKAELSDIGETDRVYTVTVTPQKLEITSFRIGDKQWNMEYRFDSIALEEDTGIRAAGVFIERLSAQEETGELLQMPPVAGGTVYLALRFTDEIPNAVTWYDQRYIARNKKGFQNSYFPFKADHTLDQVDQTLILPLEPSTMLLSSRSDEDSCYRLCRIVCRFGNELKEYDVFFDTEAYHKLVE